FLHGHQLSLQCGELGLIRLASQLLSCDLVALGPLLRHALRLLCRSVALLPVQWVTHQPTPTPARPGLSARATPTSTATDMRRRRIHLPNSMTTGNTS